MMLHLTNEKLQDYLHGALTPEEDAVVYAHLEQCELCRAEHEAESTIGDSLRAYAKATERELPSTVKAAIWSEIRSAKPSLWTRLSASFRPAIALPLAAVLAAGIYFGVMQTGAGNGPTIEAAYYLQDHADMEGTTPFSDRNVTPSDMESAAVVTNQRPVAIQEASTYTADAGNH